MMDGIALSQKILKSGAAGCNAANVLRSHRSENILRVGYLGTHQIPLIAGSSDTSFSTRSISGPSGVMGIDHFDSEMLCDSKMSVISGYRLQNFMIPAYTRGIA